MSENISKTDRPRVVIIGAGFGGLQAAKALAKAPVDVLLIDRNNYHGFWPLLYQVATAGLEPQEIAKPVRAVIRGLTNVHFQLATVERIDREQRLVITDQGAVPYDQLVVAAGSATNFFGLEQIERNGYELKDVPDALTIRNQIIRCFERAVVETDTEKRQQLLTFVVVGGGPTGVELAGAFAELIRHVLRKDYPTLDFSAVRVVLLEAADRVLLSFPAKLSAKAHRALTKLGVDVQFGKSVVGYDNNYLQFKDGATLATETVIWAAGIQANPLAKTLDVPLQRGGRVTVTPELHLPDDSTIWVIGDMAYLEDASGRPLGQLATVAMQQGRHVAANIRRQLQGQALQRYSYVDKGSMATIGRRAAVAHIWRVSFSGPIAWYLWLGVHLWYIIGFRNRVQVLVNWAYNYLTYDRGARAVFELAQPSPTTQQLNQAVQNSVAEQDNSQPEQVLERELGA
jgi:NADH dehydrogenase